MFENVKNLTPHPVTFMLPDGTIITLPPEGIVPRRETYTEDAGESINGIPIVRNTLGPVVGLPEPEEGVTLVVPFMICQACPDRKDLYAPDTTPASVVRDENGRIVGVRRLQKA